MTKICPQKIIRAASITTGCATPNTIQFLESSNTANLKRIICNVPEPILLRLLVCKDEKNTEYMEECPYPEHINTDATKKVCSDSDKKLAQIYIRHENYNNIARSCIIAFIEGKYIRETDKLLEIYQNTISWLDIAQEKPYFYVLSYGEPLFGLTTNDAKKNINIKIKEKFNEYQKGDEICNIVPVERKAEPLTINCGNKFSIRAS